MSEKKANVTFHQSIPNEEQIKADLLAGARAQGCDCNPEISVPAIERGKVSHVSVAHDDWCAMLRQQ